MYTSRTLPLDIALEHLGELDDFADFRLKTQLPELKSVSVQPHR